MIKKTGVNLDWDEDIYEEIDHKRPGEKAVIEGPKQWKGHVQKFQKRSR